MTTPHELFKQILESTGDHIAAIKAIRERFGLDCKEAKEVMIQVERWASSLDEHQQRFAEEFMKVIAEQRAKLLGSVATDYDDEQELTKYIWNYFEHLMTPFEQRVGWEHFVEQKATGGHPETATFIRRSHGLVDDPEVKAALADGIDAFRRRVSMRVLTNHIMDVHINRCRRCYCIARTPKARQCFWCGFDWHDSDKPLSPTDQKSNPG